MVLSESHKKNFSWDSDQKILWNKFLTLDQG